MIIPTNISLVQMHEGYVAIDIHKSTGATGIADINFGNPLLSTDPTHLKIYLSTKLGLLGGLHATIRIDTVGGLFFNVTPGWFGYVTVRAFNIKTLAESTNTNQLILQMFERVLPGYNIIHFFHDKRPGFPDAQYAIGFRQSDDAVFLFKSIDHFTTSQVVYSWSPGTIDNGGWLTFYIDKFGFMYIANRPSALISRDSGLTWSQLPWQFQTKDKAVLTPFWNITEDESRDLIVFSEYGTAPDGPHHYLILSTDANRFFWVTPTLQPSLNINWGKYRHIHGYHINPYQTNIHFLFLGDRISNQYNTVGPYSSLDMTPGFYVSQDSGTTWSTEILNQGGNTSHFGGDQKFRNAPCNVTWWPSGKAFIANDSAERGVAAWYGNGPINWGYLGLQPQISLLKDIDELGTWPATPWDAKAVNGGYETYCVNTHRDGAFKGDPTLPAANLNPAGDQIGYTPPSILWRYDAIPNANHDLDGVTGIKTIMAKIFYPAGPFLFMSAGRGNVFPADADYVFCNAWGGIRIPRKTKRIATPLTATDSDS